MPQSLSRNYTHLDFSTKHREPMLLDSFRDRLHDYMRGILRGISRYAVELNSEPDRVPVLFILARTVAPSDAVQQFERGSSVSLRQLDPSLADFFWQRGYGSFSVSESLVETIREYIRNQREHHRNESFRDEFRRWLDDHREPFDERYVCD